MENLKKLERRMALKMCCNLWPGISALVFLAGLFLWSAQYEEPDSHVVMQIWSLYGTLIGFYAIIMIIPFVVSALGPHFSIKCLSAGEQSRIDEDCMKGYRFGDVIVCRDCLLVPAPMARPQAVSYRDLLWIYVDKRHVYYVTVKNPTPLSVSRKPSAMPKKLGPQLDENGFYTLMQQFLPWCFFGSQPEIKEMRRRNFPALIQTVEQRRTAYLASMQGGNWGNPQ